MENWVPGLRRGPGDIHSPHGWVLPWQEPPLLPVNAVQISHKLPDSWRTAPKRKGYGRGLNVSGWLTLWKHTSHHVYIFLPSWTADHQSNELAAFIMVSTQRAGMGSPGGITFWSSSITWRGSRALLKSWCCWRSYHFVDEESELLHSYFFSWV